MEEYKEHIEDHRYTYVLLQDKDRDKYLIYNVKTRNQKSY
jgi:hypothetical protein